MGSQIFLHSFFVLILKSKGTERHSLVCLSVCLCLLLFLSLITRLTIILGDGNMDDRVPLYFSIFSKFFFHNKHLCLPLTRRESLPKMQ